MKKFIALKVNHLRLDNLAGLCEETVIAAVGQAQSLGTLGSVRMNSLDVAGKRLKSLLNQQHASILTPEVRATDRLRDADWGEIKRTVSTAARSSIPETAAAGATLLDLLKPFWHIDREPLASQTTLFGAFWGRYTGHPGAEAAVIKLGLIDVVHRLYTDNAKLDGLYNERLAAMAGIEEPSATSVKREVVAAYDSFCDVVEQTLDALPSDALQLLFHEMNDLRRKYIRHLPKDLAAGDHCVVEPVDTQKYTEKAITPIPKAHYREDGKPTVELVFAKDFSVTYKNNVNVGTAEVTLHGKGNYKGKKTVTFNIAR